MNPWRERMHTWRNWSSLATSPERQSVYSMSSQHHLLPSVAAGALARLGRNFRKLKRYPEAISAYEKLSRLAAQSEVFGLPADLVSLTGRCSVFEEKGDRKETAKDGTGDGCWPKVGTLDDHGRYLGISPARSRALWFSCCLFCGGTR